MPLEILLAYAILLCKITKLYCIKWREHGFAREVCFLREVEKRGLRKFVKLVGGGKDIGKSGAEEEESLDEDNEMSTAVKEVLNLRRDEIVVELRQMPFDKG